MNRQNKQITWMIISFAIFFGYSLLLSLSKDFFVTFETRLMYSHTQLLMIVVELLIITSIFRKETIALLKNFFLSPTHAVNLAIFRVVVFYLLFKISIEPIVYYSTLPKGIMYLPFGLHWFVPYISVINPENVKFIGLIFKITCFLSLIGLFSRFNMIISVLSAIFLLGIPNLFGKVYHGHHIIWFAIILSASPCANCFSLDALLKKVRNKSTQIQNKSLMDNSYTIALRSIWLLFGIIYFFSGFWKWWQSGIDWIFSDNLMNIMYLKWTELGPESPQLQFLEHFPSSLQIAAFGTVLFEMCFIFLLIFPKYRYIAIASGIMFHISSHFMMGIFFKSLVICYIIFIDWHYVYRRLCHGKHKEKSRESSQIRGEDLSILKIFKQNALPICIYISLICTTLSFGAMNKHSWPFTSYGLFSHIAPSLYYESLHMSITMKDGKIIPFDEYQLKKFPAVTFNSLVVKILKSEPKTRDIQLILLWNVILKENKDLQSAKNIRFYRLINTALPADRHLNPLRKTLVLEYAFGE